MKRKTLSTKARLELFQAHNGTCHVCGGKIQVGEAWEVEHVIPLALGGDDDTNNMAPVHKKVCHETKTREQDVPAIARAKRREAKHIGAKPKRPWHPTLRKKMNGEVVPR